MEQKMNNNQLPAGKPKNNKTLWFSMLGALLLIVLVVAAPRLKRAGSDTEVPAPLDTEVAADSALTPAAETAAPKALSRTEAVIKYEGRRIEFNLDCQATPATVAVQPGVSVMLDNQSNKPHTVTVGEKTYAVGAYKYRTVLLSQTGAFPVHCDAVKDASAIIVTE